MKIKLLLSAVIILFCNVALADDDLIKVADNCAQASATDLSVVAQLQMEQVPEEAVPAEQPAEDTSSSVTQPEQPYVEQPQPEQPVIEQPPMDQPIVEPPPVEQPHEFQPPAEPAPEEQLVP